MADLNQETNSQLEGESSSSGQTGKPTKPKPQKNPPSPQMVVPNEDERPFLRPGNLDWVPAFCKNPDNHRNYQDWRFAFIQGAKLHLTLGNYKTPDNLHQGWVLAFLKSANLCGEEGMGARELRVLVQRMVEDPQGRHKGADMMKGIDQRWMKDQDLEKRNAVNGFLQYQREGTKGLQQSIRTLRDLLFEARRCGYDPDEETVVSKFEGLLLNDEKTLHTLLKNTDQEGGSKLDICVRALEQLAKDRQGNKGSANVMSGANAVANASNSRGRGRGRGGYNGPRRSGYAQDADEKAAALRKCQYCGSATCKSLKSGGKREDCRAHKEECHTCKKTGHFASVCRKGKQSAAGAASADKKRDSPKVEGGSF
jgi:hypothetical protein